MRERAVPYGWAEPRGDARPGRGYGSASTVRFGFLRWRFGGGTDARDRVSVDSGAWLRLNAYRRLR